MILILLPEFKKKYFCFIWFLCSTEIMFPSSSFSHPESLQTLHSTSSICSQCCFLYPPLEPSGKDNVRKLWHNSDPQALHICSARHAIKVQQSPVAPIRCGGLTRSYIHSSGDSSCLTLHFDKSQSVWATLSSQTTHLLWKGHATYSPECMPKNVDYSKVAEHIFLKPCIYIYNTNYCYSNNIMYQEVSHT